MFTEDRINFYNKVIYGINEAIKLNLNIRELVIDDKIDLNLADDLSAQLVIISKKFSKLKPDTPNKENIFLGLRSQLDILETKIKNPV